jgi:hypothetical protein
VERNEELDHRDDVLDVEDGRLAVGERAVDAELPVDLVPADLREVVALRVEVEVVEQRLGRLDRGRLARTELPVDVEECVLAGLGRVLLERRAHRVVVAELLEDLALGPAERLEQDGHRLLALAVEADADLVALVDLELEPRTARRDDLRREDVLVARLVGGALEVGTRGANELRDDDALGAVDDERALLGHEREVAHEHGLLLDLARVVVHELGLDVQRGRVGGVALLALLHRVLRVRELGVGEAQGHGALEVFDRGDFLEDVGEAGRRCNARVALFRGLGHAGLPALVADEPVKGLSLEGQQVGDVEGLVDLGE